MRDHLKSLYRKLAGTNLHDLSWLSLWMIFGISFLCLFKGISFVSDAVVSGDPEKIVIALTTAFATVVFVFVVHNDMMVKEEKPVISGSVRKLIRESGG